ncbi:MAG: NAD(+)/NADH kinase [Tepidanaerobacteraceae bacterium]|nr:NAD(+)/NADH kinase [Tepidanaerobacteraceae bacterium]
MKSIGIIANPASGKDIRRLVAHATIIDNNEKVNIVKRIILSAQELGVKEIYIMPDTFNIGFKARDDLASARQLAVKVYILDMQITASLKDTIRATEILQQLDVGCIISLGGDGTNRAIAKALQQTPLLPISTGTNNVYPDVIEGTVAGIAAAVAASEIFDLKDICIKNKRIEILNEGGLLDIALVDAVICNETFVGARAVWSCETISDIIVTKSRPNAIGFSSVPGYIDVIEESDDFGGWVKLGHPGETVVAPIAPGVVRPVPVKSMFRLELDRPYRHCAKQNSMIALDGEREIPLKKSCTVDFVVTRNGPYQLNVEKTLRAALKTKFFRKVCI